jgi:hypothetical protein
MPSSVTIVPVVREREKKRDGTFPVRIRITFKRRQKVVSTNIAVERWQLTKSFEIKDPAVGEAVSSLVRDMRAAANAISPYELESLEVGDVAARIERALSGSEAAFRLDFPDFFERVAGEKTKNARTNYLCALHSLCSFVGAEHFDIAVVTSSLMRRYEAHLRAKHGNGARAVSLYTSAVAYVHRRAREEYNNEELGEVPIRNPFEYYRCPKQQAAKHRNVDADVVRAMLRLRGALSGRERLGVDLFLISFALMGMNTPDIYSCAKPVGGVLVYNRTKTRGRRADGAEMHVRIEPCARAILSEYADDDRAFSFHCRYSDYKNLGRAANVGLSAFSRRIGCGKIEVYSARHTWASVAFSAGIGKGTINDCLCHVDRDMRVTDIYIKKDWGILWSANAKVLSLFDWPR